jgi:adenylate cyclase
MADQHEHMYKENELWQHMITVGEFRKEGRQRQFFKFLPGDVRCKICHAPFDGFGGSISWNIFHKRPSGLNPRFCTSCEEFAKSNPGGTETELSLLFADVRGSTRLAEEMSASEFGSLINRFYGVATNALAKSDALIDKIIGDQASGMYVPGFAGPDHARQAIEAAREILIKTGHGEMKEPWIPLGIGVHTGVAYVGTLGSKDGSMDFTALGDVPNIAARLSSSAGVGEILVTEPALEQAKYEGVESVEKRNLSLKGKSNKISVRVMTV